jgi:hypothetical protein
MKTTITIMRFYPYRYWFWYFRKFKFVKGFVIRIFGIHFIVKEENHLEKLIEIGQKMSKIKT